MREQFEHHRYSKGLADSHADDEIGRQRFDRMLNRRQIVDEPCRCIGIPRVGPNGAFVPPGAEASASGATVNGMTAGSGRPMRRPVRTYS
ncbi:TPA: hypothetical protein SAY52_000238 [Burkholderia cenocepacia]|uniref:hypothetical protein n=1 Tax=unclassified Burkholderia TaxID=2613784 RepID=UPI00158F3E2A|nr:MULTISPECIES: hypothetical protein [unclassified Burkholderia]HEF5869686.1 hypothetical protein [Burkholderia cenocepacia]